MKEELVNYRFQRVRRLKRRCARGSPLPRQGEGEGEGFSRATRTVRRTPHLNPLPFAEGRGGKSRVHYSANSTVAKWLD